MDDYEQGIARLIERVRRLNVPWNPTQRRKELERFAERLDELVGDLDDFGGAQFDIECEHDEEPPPDIGVDGLPIELEDRPPKFKAVLWNMRLLSASARRAAARLPSPRQRHALPYAAMGLLHLRMEHGFDRPKLSGSSEEVQELARICKAAGIFKAPETLRNALSDALKDFDPHYNPYDS